MINRRTLLKFLPASLAGLVAAPVLAKVGADDGPRWPPQCPDCVWLGRWQGADHLYDLWGCIRGLGAALHLGARYGPESAIRTWCIWNKHVPTSGGRITDDLPEIDEAYRRARAKGLVPKVKSKPKFPRYFALTRFGVIDARVRKPIAYLRADADDWIVSVHYDGTQQRRVRCTQVFDKAGRRWGPGPATMRNIEHSLRTGFLREITAAEAKALLKPKRQVVASSKARPFPLINRVRYMEAALE